MNLTWDEMAFLCSGQEAPASDGGLTQFLSPCGTAYIAVKKESDVYYWGLLAAYRRWRAKQIDALLHVPRTGPVKKEDGAAK